MTKTRSLLIGLTFLLAVPTIALADAQQDKALEDGQSIVDDGEELFREAELFADSVTLISTDYVENVKAKDLVYGAIRGMMDTLDGYSQFLDPESFREITEETRGEFAGIGIEIGIRDGVLTIIAPIEDTPAEKAGVRAGDRIVKIAGKITREMSLDDAVDMLRGEPGTEVSMTVVREETDEVIDLKVRRAIIKMKSIKDALLLDDDIAYIRIGEFQERTAPDLVRNIERLREEGALDLVLDLRNNPGGLLDASIESADIFLEPGKLIVYTEGRDPLKKVEFTSREPSKFDDMAIVVLVNKGSASAAEILAGALADNSRGITLGTRTFGKGSVQTVIPLKDKSALRLTTAAYFTPSGKTIREEGIHPDIEVTKIRVKKVSEKDGKRDDARDQVFDRLDEKSAREADKKSAEEKTAGEELLRKDNQVRAAVNVIKGARLIGGRSSGPSDGHAARRVEVQ